MKRLLVAFTAFLFFSCSTNSSSQPPNEEKKHLFDGVKEKESEELELPKGFSFDVLFQEGDEVETEEGTKHPSKGSHDLVIYLPDEGSSDEGELFVSHESADLNKELGNGGGASIFKVQKKKKDWKVKGDIKNINFQNVGFTMRNCGGKTTPYGTILMAEETYPNKPEELIGNIVASKKQLNDTLHQNFGWMVEVDPKTRKPIRKLTGMGRYSHEDAICLPDNRSVILTNDESPAVLFKFVAEKENDFSKGQLYAYREKGAHWIALPMALDSLKNAKAVAINKGATLFARLEWGTLLNNNVYLTETGHDSIDWNKAVAKGGVPASHFNRLQYAPNKYNDWYGRVLGLDLSNDSLFVQLEGGKTEDGGMFSNPDCISNFRWKGNDYLMMSEDITGLSNGRVSADAFAKNTYYNEVYIQELATGKVTRFATAPRGSETTGLFFTPDYNTLFLSIQHPTESNKAPFSKTSVIAIKGF